MTHMPRIAVMAVLAVVLSIVGQLAFTAPAAACCDINLDKSQGPPGTVITVSSGPVTWTPDSQLEMEWLFAPGVVAGRVTTDASGTFQVDIGLPADAPVGPTTLFVANTKDTNERAQAAFNVESSPNPPPPPPPPPACKKVAVVGLRGSGDPAKPNQFGPTLKPVVDAIVKHFGQDQVELHGIRYKALPVPSKFTVQALLDWHDSLVGGQRLATTELQALTRGSCATERKILILGYSQGAWAAHLMLDNLQPEVLAEIDGVGFFGNPLFDPRSDVAAGSYDQDPRYGLIRTKLMPASLRPALPGELVGKTLDFCYFHDAICSGPKHAGGKVDWLPTYRNYQWVKDCEATIQNKCSHFFYQEPVGQPVQSMSDFMIFQASQ